MQVLEDVLAFYSEDWKANVFITELIPEQQQQPGAKANFLEDGNEASHPSMSSFSG